jgi:hypothetical protein
VTVEGQAVIVEVRVVNTVEVVISCVVPAGEEIAGDVTAVVWDTGAPEVDESVQVVVSAGSEGLPGVVPVAALEDWPALLEAGFAGPVTVVVRVIGPGVLVGDTGEMWIEDAAEDDGMDTGIVPTLEEPWELVWTVAGTEGVAETLEDPCGPGPLGEPEGTVTLVEVALAEGEAEATGVLDTTGGADGVLIGTETLVNEEVPQLSTREMLVTSTVEPTSSSPSQPMMMKRSEDDPVAVHCLVRVVQESLTVRALAPSSSPLRVISMLQLTVAVFWR